MFLIYILNSFSDFFPERGFDCLTRYQLPSSNFYLADCFFSSLYFVGSGGILNYNTDNVHLVVELCSFFNCSCSVDGGAIYFVSLSGAYVINKCCAKNCRAGSEGHFAYLQGNSMKNGDILYSTLYFCSPDNTGTKYYSIRTFPGKIGIKNTNSSFCISSHGSSFYIANGSPFFFNYSNIENGYSTYHCLHIMEATSECKISTINFINNTVTSASYAIIHSAIPLTFVFECVFYLNKGFLFNGFLTCQLSWFEHNSGLTIGSNVMIISSIPFEFTYRLINFGTALCITPIPPPEPTTSSINGLEITPCLTLYPNPTPPQSIPQPPTECLFPSNSNLGYSMTSIFELLLIHLTII